MKLTKICLLLFCFPAIAWANGKNDVQFIENKGQVTDQHGAVRRDIYAKIEANGVTMFLGDGEWHYQWSRPAAVDSGQLTGGSSAATTLREQPTPAPLPRVTIYVLGQGGVNKKRSFERIVFNR